MILSLFCPQVTSLHLAAQFRSSPVLKVLLEAGADVSMLDSEQRSPLHYAALGNDNIEVIELLIEAGMDNGH